MKPSIIILFVYGILISVGGTIGYFKSGSLISLVCGLVLGTVIVAAALGCFYEQRWGLPLAYGATLFACALFLWRTIQTKALFPAGFLLLIGFLTFVCLSYEIVKNIVRRG